MTQDSRLNIPIILCVIAVIVVVGRLFLGGGDDPSLTSKDPDKRLIAMESLRQQYTPAARAKLREMMQDPDPRIVVQSIRAMGNNRDESNHRQLLTLTAPDHNPLHRREALAALGHYPEVNVSQFVSVLNQDKEPQARVGAAIALARRADKSTVPVMFKALSDPDPEVRGWAITGIKNITHKGFPYDPALPGNQQLPALQNIANYLRKNGFM